MKTEENESGITPKGRAVIALLGVGFLGAVAFGINYWQNNLAPVAAPSAVPEVGHLEEFQERASQAPSEDLAMPSDVPAALGGMVVRMLVLPWNAQIALMFANGGADTTEGSLMAEEGVSLHLEMQDDYGKQKLALIACAEELAAGASDCKNGAQLVTIMGDAAALYVKGLNDTLSRLGDDYQAEIVPGFGRSFGEDKFMAPPACLKNKDACRGLLIAGVPGDGDVNTMFVWADNNQICVNVDPGTYDKDCLNLLSTATFGEADAKYIAGYCEERAVVKNGRRVGGRENVCVSGVATWTPGDVEVTEQKGGLASILSTRETGSQMPNVLIGIRKWNRDNEATLASILRAGYAAAPVVRSNPEALLKGGEVSAKVYGQKDAAYWVRYYKGVTVTDKTGKIDVPLGGSRVFSYADARLYFGLEDGISRYKVSYDTFGAAAHKYWPKDLPSVPPLDGVLNLRVLKAVGEGGKVVLTGAAETPDFTVMPATTQKVADRTWDIRFRSNSAEFDRTAEAELQALLEQLVIADELRVEVHGHTDAEGDAEKNMTLSERRAFAVKAWLERKASAVFPTNRVTVRAHGETEPMLPNDTPDGRAANRRVQIVLTSGS